MWRSASTSSRSCVAGRSGKGTEKRRSRSEEHTSELQSPYDIVCRLPLEKKKKRYKAILSNLLTTANARFTPSGSSIGNTIQRAPTSQPLTAYSDTLTKSFTHQLQVCPIN